MPRRTASALIAAALIAAPAAASPPAHASWQAGVRVAECAPASRRAVFYAWMKRAPGTSLMSMRLTLLERTGLAGFVPLRVPGLGQWRTSQPGRGGFAVRQRVRNLSAGAAYRTRVEFRWRNRAGKPVHSERRESHPCEPAGRLLPNLFAGTAG